MMLYRQLILVLFTTFLSFKSYANLEESHPDFTYLNSDMEQALVSGLQTIRESNDKAEGFYKLFDDLDLINKDIYLWNLYFDSIEDAQLRLDVSELMLNRYELDCRKEAYIWALGYTPSLYLGTEKLVKLWNDLDKPLTDCDLLTATDSLLLQSYVIFNAASNSRLHDQAVGNLERLIGATNLDETSLYARSFLFFVRGIQIQYICLNFWKMQMQEEGSSSFDCQPGRDALSRLIDLVPELRQSENAYLRAYFMPFIDQRYGETVELINFYKSQKKLA